MNELASAEMAKIINGNNVNGMMLKLPIITDFGKTKKTQERSMTLAFYLF